MDAAWPSLMGVDPRDLQLNRTESYDLNISPQENSSNGIQYNDDSWPNVQASTGGFMQTALAGPHLISASLMSRCQPSVEIIKSMVHQVAHQIPIIEQADTDLCSIRA